ncbi:MAG: hypothetical protein LQ338_006846 [Usnochroma carphineum]|nr:MAG: hypothetical protein LQ338_006846 [Usnochroma carphineum]
MKQTTTDTEKTMDELDRQRQRLEEIVEKLRKSIKIWQTWEAEYEGLKEELQTVGNDASSSVLQDVGNQFDGELLNQKEVNLLLLDDKKQPRTSHQVIGLLSRRMEYVQSNIKSLRGSLEAAEDKLTASQALSAPQQKDEEGFPLMEIQEELDEDDNVISSSMIPASEAAPQVVEALRKAGVQGLQSHKQDKVPEQTSAPSTQNGEVPTEADKTPSALKQVSHSGPKLPSNQQSSPSTSESDNKGSDGKGGRRRKSVTFADGTKQAPPTPTLSQPAKDVQAAKAASRARRIKAEVRGSIDALKKVHNAGHINEEVFDRFRREYVDRLHNLPQTTSKPTLVQRQARSSQQHGPTGKNTKTEEFDPVMPPNESPEDAALRREMIRYNMNEVGAVVAEMNLDDEEENHSSSPEYSNEEGEHQGSSDDDENAWGMSTTRAVTSDYIEEMQTLEKRLKAGSVQNGHVKPTIEALLRAEDELVVGPDGNPLKRPLQGTNAPQERKAVRFAQDLDVQERQPSPKLDNGSEPGAKKASTPVQADVVERPVTANRPPNTTAPITPKKMSRFKATRSAQVQAAATPKKSSPLQITANNGNPVKTPSLPAFTPPATPKITATGPPGQTHAPNVLERPYSDDVISDNLLEPDEFDASLLRQELTMDYHRTRNRMIQRQGGFLANDDKEEEEEEGPVIDENGKKISRFKAARLQGMNG